MSETGQDEVIITGAGGAIGRQLVNHLLQKGSLPILNYFTEAEVPAEIGNHKNIRIVIGDISEYDVLKKLINKDCRIVHLASSVNPSLYAGKLTDGFIKSMRGSLALLDYLKENPYRVHLIFPSSGGTVYQDSDKPHLENEYVCGSSVYGISKLTLESQILLLCRANPRLTANILRISNPYGMCLDKNRKQGFIDVALQKFIDGEEIEIWSDLRTIRDYIHYEDLNQAFEKALEYQNGAEIFNIGAGEGHSLADIFELIQVLFKEKAQVRFCSNPSPTAYPLCNILNIDKARRILGYHPLIDIKSGLLKAYAEKAGRHE